MSRVKIMGCVLALGWAMFAAGSAAREAGRDGPGDGRSGGAGTSRGGPSAERSRSANPPGRDFNEVTRGAEKIEGLFTLYKTDAHLYAEFPPHLFNQPFLAPATIARGLGMTGEPIGRGDEMVLVFRRVGDRIQVVRRNVRFRAPSGTPLAKSVEQNYTDSILMSLPIASVNPMRGGAVLFDLSDIFMTDFPQLGLGAVDRGRCRWIKAKGFPNNVELEVEVTYQGGGRGQSSAVPDRRGVTVVLHHSLIRAPRGGYRPRTADDRVGHFLNAVKDFGVTSSESNFVRMINRWRLEKADPKAKLSPPKRQIVWYVEDTVPIEYRPYVQDGILEWNKAFEKIGFRDALAVRWQEAGRDDFDPEDANYCTFRWVTGERGAAMSCLRGNPMTGEMIDGDVVFDAGFIRAWKRQYAVLVRGDAASGDGLALEAPIALGEVISPILASRMGYGQPATGAPLGLDTFARPRSGEALRLVPSNQNMLAWRLAQDAARDGRNVCTFQTGVQRDFALAAVVMAAPTSDEDRDDADAKKDDDKDKNKDAKKDDDKNKDGDKNKDEVKRSSKRPHPRDELPEEFVGQAIKHIVMHEVGHSLGLRHNFKASTMLKVDELNDTAITRVKGLSGSVMDYTPINIAPPGTKQGDYYSTTLGPYDYWAIEYAYKPILGDETSELKKIASRAAEPGLAYATDEDVSLNDDPYVNRWDLGSDPCEFGRRRIALAAELLKDLDARVVAEGESWERARRAFSLLLQQWGDGAALAAGHIAGQSVSRDHKADKGGRDPIVPVSGDKQRDCLKFLVESILSDRSFQFSPSLLRRLGNERWSHWGESGRSGPGTDISVLERILGIQKIVLAHCLSGRTLARLQNQQLQANPGAGPLQLEEVFRALTDGVWSDLERIAKPSAEKDAKKDGPRDKSTPEAISVIRRNLQREHLRRLYPMVLGDGGGSASSDRYPYVVFVRGGPTNVPADARALARLHLKEIAERIGKALGATGAAKMDDTTRAHLEECQHRIAKVLDADLDVLEP